MLTTLAIKNYALIQDIKVQFTDGLTTITGETGAGKSILLGALSLLLGKRADLSNVRNADEKCVIEGDFLIGDYGLKELFQDLDFDYDDHTILRREILPSGKSRAFVNDSPVNLNQLQQLGERLVDIHSQHETRSLLAEKNQLEVIDAVANNAAALAQYKKELQSYKRLETELFALTSERDTAARELDYHTFLFNELTEAHIDAIDQQELEETYEKLNNSETIQEGLAATLQYLSDEQSGALETAKEARMHLHKLKGFSSEYAAFWEQINSAILELEDVAASVSDAADALDVDPAELFQIQERLQTLYKLQQKHNVSTVDELKEILADLDSKIEGHATMDDRIEMLQKSMDSAKKTVLEIASDIRKRRTAVFPELKEMLEKNLHQLGLPNARFQFEIQEAASFKENGKDQLTWLFTANKGTALESMNKVVSGGELSRIMLSIKAVMAKYKKLPTLIFDEIDTGVSGEVAQQMAGLMEE
ncbi:MAG: AAA family ATPase, partial [Marinirhabdus sp.]|nr:AAA family ATPase [Marinirhabdus sp.]